MWHNRIRCCQNDKITFNTVLWCYSINLPHTGRRSTFLPTLQEYKAPCSAPCHHCIFFFLNRLLIDLFLKNQSEKLKTSAHADQFGFGQKFRSKFKPLVTVFRCMFLLSWTCKSYTVYCSPSSIVPIPVDSVYFWK